MATWRSCLAQSLRWLKIKLKDVRIVLITIGLIGVLLFASPTISLFVKAPVGQEFSEIYILSSNHTLNNLPFNIVANVNYLVYLGVVNQMGSSCYYTALVKVANTSNYLPNATLEKPSTLPSLFEFNTFLSNGEAWETPLVFQVNQLAFTNGVSQLSSITINGVTFPIDQTSTWNSNNSGYYYYLFVELWLFNPTLGASQYNNRFVSLVLNMTQ